MERPILTYEQMEEFKKLCTPVAKFLKKNCCLMQTAVITVFDCKIVSDELGMPIVYGDKADAVTVDGQTDL